VTPEIFAAVGLRSGIAAFIAGSFSNEHDGIRVSASQGMLSFVATRAILHPVQGEHMEKATGIGGLLFRARGSLRLCLFAYTSANLTGRL